MEFATIVNQDSVQYNNKKVSLEKLDLGSYMT